MIIVFLSVNLAIADDNTIGALVPGYGNPNDTDLWSLFVATAKQDPNLNLAIILNPDNGPGDSLDFNYLNNLDEGPLAELQTTKAIVYGYVFTRIPKSEGEPEELRPLNEVKDDIDGYLYDENLYAGFVQGIFIDTVSSNLQNVDYYQELVEHVQMRLKGAPVIGNPGQPNLVNPSGQIEFDEADFVATFDAIVTFENFGEAYINQFVSAPHLEGLPNSRIAHIVHTQPDWDRQLLEISFSRGAGMIYFTDDSCDGDDCGPLENPFDILATYWDEFVSDISNFNARTGPFARGNMNDDEVVNLLDVAPFVEQLISGQYRLQADLNCDGSVDLLDVAPFVQVLTGS